MLPEAEIGSSDAGATNKRYLGNGLTVRDCPFRGSVSFPASGSGNETRRQYRCFAVNAEQLAARLAELGNPRPVIFNPESDTENTYYRLVSRIQGDCRLQLTRYRGQTAKKRCNKSWNPMRTHNTLGEPSAGNTLRLSKVSVLLLVC